MLNHRKIKKMLRHLFKEIEPPISSWKIEEEVYDKLSIEVLNKIYTEAELRFNTTVDDISEVRKKAYNLITIFISLLSVLLTLYFGEFFKSSISQEKTLIVLYFIDIILILIVVFQLIIIIIPNSIMLKGVEPKLMNYKGMASLDENEQTKLYLFDSVEAIQQKIEYNEYILDNKNNRLEKVIFTSITIFLLSIIFELIIKMF